MRVSHLITDLSAAGAQTMLYKLLAGTNPNDVQSEVVSLTDLGPMAERISALGVPVQAVGMRRGVPDPVRLLSLAKHYRAYKPDLIQSWMYHSDLVAGIAASLAGRIPVVWGIRQSNLDPAVNKRTTIWTAQACARLSHVLPRRILCCSEASRRVHEAIGYDRSRMVVIPNGFDLRCFGPDAAARSDVRAELGLSPDTLIIGLMARFDLQKDHRTFLRAAGLLHKRCPEVHFLLAGDDITWSNHSLATWANEEGIVGCTHLLGRRSDVARLTAAFDIASTSSVGEGFPNVVGEAMACAVPCVVTDVGDSASIVDDTGLVVPPGNPAALAAAWESLASVAREERLRLGDMARKRVQTHFDLSLIVERYYHLYSEILET